MRVSCFISHFFAVFNISSTFESGLALSNVFLKSIFQHCLCFLKFFVAFSILLAYTLQRKMKSN